ncbi:MAG: hypothetical protein CMJ74_05560 [Planctomycetaceae bacterium]|nr:hypothetical protein [Planctomycetaceae bacterium]|tara:strand:+ start:25172 stop:26206 length:1035 start_codon:yes stop_codon:yes gene_type:complete
MSKISTAQLLGLCGRMATSLEAGIDVRIAWKRESERARASAAATFSKITSSLSRGDSLTDALAEHRDRFPALFLQMVEIGEAAGKLPAVFGRLAAHYENRIRLRRLFVAGITWPMMQFFAAIFIVGFLIWILDAIAQTRGPAAYDILGIGLTGSHGLLIYVLLWVGIFSLTILLFFLIRHGFFQNTLLERAIFRLPVLGSCLSTICLARFSWTLGLLLESGMDVRRVVPYAFSATGSQFFMQYQVRVSSALQQGEELSVALLSTGIFPNDFLDPLQVGEQTGRLDESMLRLAEHYEERSRRAIAVITKIITFFVWAMVAAMIIGIIVKMVAGYAGFLQQLSGSH